MKNCSEINELMNLYIDDMLSVTERKIFEEHIGRCKACALELNELTNIVNYCRSISDEELPEGFRESLNKKLANAKAEMESYEKKILVFKNRYLRIFSSVAAVLVVFVFIKGITGNINMIGRNSKMADMPKMEAKAGGKNSEAAKNDGINNKSEGIQAFTANNDEQNFKSDAFEGVREEDNTSDAKMKSKESVSIAPAKALEDSVKSAPSRGVKTEQRVITKHCLKICIKAAALCEEIESIRSIAEAFGGIPREVPEAAVTAYLDQSAAKLEVMIPNMEFELFKEKLKKKYNSQDICFEPLLEEDSTASLNEISRKLGELDDKIKGAPENLEELKKERESLQKEMDQILFQSEYTSVSITIIKDDKTR
ncbi:MAG: zf-HC2 domain-containing protein [Clostridia bacterium]|nr:zf-HC2 domain-containing protein [Clostridia bacterium]